MGNLNVQQATTADLAGAIQDHFPAGAVRVAVLRPGVVTVVPQTMGVGIVSVDVWVVNGGGGMVHLEDVRDPLDADDLLDAVSRWQGTVYHNVLEAIGSIY